MNNLLPCFAALTLAACASGPSYGPDPAAIASYERRVLDTPVPTTEAEHNATCRELRLEVARQQGIVAAAPHDAQLTMMAGRNVALIESKMAEFGCASPFMAQ